MSGQYGQYLPPTSGQFIPSLGVVPPPTLPGSMPSAGNPYANSLEAPQAMAGVDRDGDGRADYVYMGADRNVDGIPDALQAPAGTMMMPPGSMRSAPPQTLPPMTGMVPGSQAPKPPISMVGVDTTGDGRPDYYYVGVDRNVNGIPDALQAQERPMPTMRPMPTNASNRMGMAPPPTIPAPVKYVGETKPFKASEGAPLVPAKDLESRIMNIACFMMFSLCFLPVMGAIASLCDRHYVFWMGCFWPTIVILGCLFVFVTFVATIYLLSKYATLENRSQFTMAFTWATFVALLGIILVPISLMANKYAAHVAGTVSQGCMSSLPQSEYLADYSQVLYNIRLSPNCTDARSVTECEGWSRNWYTDYLEFLESDMQCGPLCPENPPPASAVVAPKLHTDSLPWYPDEDGSHAFNSFLQGESWISQQVSLLHRQHHKASGLHQKSLHRWQPFGVMETALPHVQARRLFEKGTTRMTCFPLIATRLQVLLQTFGGLWYLEGMGLIVISFFTSLYTGFYFAFNKNTAST